MRFLAGNAIALLENGEQYFPALEAAIDAAAHEIFLQSYIFDDDPAGRRIADALVRAAGRGVAVRVMVDGFGGRNFVSGLLPRLREAGVQVLIYRRELRPLSLRRHRLRRLHRKVVVVDGRVAFVGGINVVDDFDAGLLSHPRYDYAVQVEGPLLEPIVASVQRLWRLVAWASFRRRDSQPLLAPPRTKPAGDIRAAFVVRDNLRYRHAIENAYLDAIAGAREEIVIASAYFFPGRRFRQALVDAADRGVRVTLLLQGLSDHPLQVYATRALYPMFLARGIRLFEYHRSHMHAKVAVVDRHWSTVGSSNIDAFSLLLAREANVVVDDTAFAGRLRASLESAICDGARELKPSDWQRLPLLRRGLSWLAYQIVRLAIGIAGFGRSH
ncbi:cardiolipin synthase ClsB [Thauera sp.]|jgi:cardiolipin synthase|uniref:cardiolipin synthase ClsB n=1 Tax=Thauera sp. TaxID=1905334 RepID=UPI002A36DB67|nr:cardiolipin synthase ClsB [Thauera sp.]MDX9885811.1 cardiolipin synthase ClsB [Thauera sp.]